MLAVRFVLPPPFAEAGIGYKKLTTTGEIADFLILLGNWRYAGHSPCSFESSTSGGFARHSAALFGLPQAA